MDTPLVRPGLVKHDGPLIRVVAYFYNSAQANAAIQLLTALGVPGDAIGVTTPDRIDTGQGMVLAIGCPDESLVPRVESICRAQGAEIHRQRA
jgi:hypothetical protein